MPPPRARADRWHFVVAGGVLVAAGCAAYANTFSVPFLLDDRAKIADNPSIRSLRHLGAILAAHVPTAAGRPLLNLSFALNFAWSGERVWSYHLVNLAIHLLAGLTLAGIVRRSLLSPGLRERWAAAAGPLSGAVAALWILHPLQTEAVTYLSQRAESLMGLFYLLTLYGFIRFTEPGRTGAGWGWISVLCCLLGMATKEVMVTAPLIVLLYDRAFVAGSGREAWRRRRIYYLGLIASWLLLALLLRSQGLTARGAGFHVGVDPLAYSLTELKAVADYVKLAFWPYPLVFDYGPELPGHSWREAAPGAFLVLVLLSAAILAWRRSRPLGFAAAAFFLLLAPTSSFVPVEFQPMAESRMYLPLACLLTVAAAAAWSWGRRPAMTAAAVAALLLGLLTVQRNHDYRSALSLWEDTVAKRPSSSRGHNNLANELAKTADRLPEARAHYEEALRIYPDYADAHNNLATVLGRLPGGQAEALDHYATALRLKPDFAEAHGNLGVELSRIPGRLPEALAECDLAVRLKPDWPEAHFNLATVLAQIPGRGSDAMAQYREALRLRPSFAEAHYNLAAQLSTSPDTLAEAIAECQEAVRLRPDFAKAHVALGALWEKLPDHRSDAMREYSLGLTFDPNNQMAREKIDAIRMSP